MRDTSEKEKPGRISWGKYITIGLIILLIDLLFKNVPFILALALTVCLVFVILGIFILWPNRVENYDWPEDWIPPDTVVTDNFAGITPEDEWALEQIEKTKEFNKKKKQKLKTFGCKHQWVKVGGVITKNGRYHQKVRCALCSKKKEIIT